MSTFLALSFSFYHDAYHCLICLKEYRGENKVQSYHIVWRDRKLLFMLLCRHYQKLTYRRMQVLEFQQYCLMIDATTTITNTCVQFIHYDSHLHTKHTICKKNLALLPFSNF